MEPLVQTILCPSCGDAQVHFDHSATTGCEECGFQIACYHDRDLAAAHLASYRKDQDVIVCEPVRFGARRWLIAHTRLFLV